MRLKVRKGSNSIDEGKYFYDDQEEKKKNNNQKRRRGKHVFSVRPFSFFSPSCCFSHFLTRVALVLEGQVDGIRSPRYNKVVLFPSLSSYSLCLSLSKFNPACRVVCVCVWVQGRVEKNKPRKSSKPLKSTPIIFSPLVFDRRDASLMCQTSCSPRQ